MNKLDLFFGTVFSTLSLIFTYLLGGIDSILQGLLVLMGLDIVSGILCAIIRKTLASRKMYVGLVRKIGVLLIISVSVILGNVFSEEWLRNAVIGFFIGAEVISILENWGNAGLPIPDQLRRTLAQIVSKYEGFSIEEKKEDKKN